MLDPDHQNFVCLLLLGYRTGRGNYIFLIDHRRHKLKAIEPDYSLLIIRVGPEGMEGVIGSDRQAGVVTDESAAEAVARVYRIRSDHLHAT